MTMPPTRFACGVSLSSPFKEDIFDSLLWVDKLVFPFVMIYDIATEESVLRGDATFRDSE